MKVLWFSPTPSLYGENTVHHNGGGWVGSLERLLRDTSEVELGVAFVHEDTVFKSVQNRVAYYPISANNRLFQKIWRKVGLANECDSLLECALDIIADFKPDIIHVFGSEFCFGLLSLSTDIPVVVHMQGSLPSYENARFPPGYSRFDLLRASRGNPLKLYRLLSNDATFRKRAIREEHILRSCHYFMGRTEWDRAITSIYNKTREYEFCSEALRPEIFHHAKEWSQRNGARRRIELVSTISMPLYKGMDVILKTARLLTQEFGMDIRWQVFGVDDCKLQEFKAGILSKDCGVFLRGVVEVEVIRDELLNSDIYVHPSYIDNSPNSLCEAQVLGVPVVATSVGGVSSLIEHGKSGYLVPANEPHMMAYRISQLIDDTALAAQFSCCGAQIALARHNPSKIISDLLTIYAKVIRRSAERSRSESHPSESIRTAR